jgi:predicted transcriptional regulator
MTLNEYLQCTGTLMIDFARKVGTTTATISRIADGSVVPRKALILRIHKATEGRVTANDLVGTYCVEPCPSVRSTKGDR